MGQRPLSITIIGWGLIVWGFFSVIYYLYGLLVLGSPDVSVPMQKFSARAQETAWVVVDFVFAWLILLALGEILVGTFILAGAKWTRTLFVVAFVLKLLLDYMSSSSHWLWDFIPGMIVAVGLFLPRANQYFSAPRA